MAKIGRPSKGDRTVIYTRAPTTVIDKVKAEAARRGLPAADVVAEILCEHYGEDYPYSRIPRNQEALDLKTA